MTRPGVCKAADGWRRIDMFEVCLSCGAAMGERRDHEPEPNGPVLARPAVTSTAEWPPGQSCDVCGEDVPWIALTPSFHNPSVVGHRACVETNPCGVCKKPVLDESTWQEHIGKVWRGHRECAQAEAAKYVLVLRADLEIVLSSEGACEYGFGDGVDERLAAVLDERSPT